jgi:hypothetical protein
MKKVRRRERLIYEIDEQLEKIALASGDSPEDAKNAGARIIAMMIMKGDPQLVKEYWQQRDGKPVQRMSMEGEGGGISGAIVILPQKIGPPVKTETDGYEEEPKV